jgi:L-proline---[L-prolyl-carrier protein] ligase
MSYLLQHLVTASAQRHPERVAVRARGRTLSYAALETESNRLARLLRERGIRRGDRVGLWFPKAIESVIAMLGTLKAGAVYVPIDPHAPPRRAAYLLRDCGIRALVTTHDRHAALGTTAGADVRLALLVPDARGEAHRPADGGAARPWSDVAPMDGASPPCEAIETDLAYILYTSGSTGEPKGVMLTHRNALTFVDWCAATFAVGPDDRLANHAPLHFDLSVFDVYNALGAGASVSLVHEDIAVFPQRLAAMIEQQAISIWYSVPSALVYLMRRGDLGTRDLSALRLVLFAGEVFPMKYLRELVDLLPGAAFYNLYGPTETNVCTYHRVDPARLPTLDRLPIGRACDNTEVFALDERGERVAPGATGELHVRGPSVTPGYWGDAAKTARALVPDRDAPHAGDRVYRTGDLVTQQPTGEYLFIGRRDNMVKSRGYRIELGEIEAALYAHPAVLEAATLAVADEEIGARIRAYAVVHAGADVSARALQAHCATLLPRYMLPESIQLRPALPRTSTGKIDRAALASSALEASAA